MILEEFTQKLTDDLEEFRQLWESQAANTELDFPEWMDLFWGWSENKWDKELKSDL